MGRKAQCFDSRALWWQALLPLQVYGREFPKSCSLCDQPTINCMQGEHMGFSDLLMSSVLATVPLLHYSFKRPELCSPSQVSESGKWWGPRRSTVFCDIYRQTSDLPTPLSLRSLKDGRHLSWREICSGYKQLKTCYTAKKRSVAKQTLFSGALCQYALQSLGTYCSVSCQAGAMGPPKRALNSHWGRLISGSDF